MHPVFLARGQAPPRFRSRSSPPRPGPSCVSGLIRAQRAFADAAGFEPKAGRHLLLPTTEGGLAASCSRSREPMTRTRTCFGRARSAASCPRAPTASPTRRTTRGWRRSPSRSARYRFTRYRKQEQKDIRLELPEGVDGDELSRIAEGVSLARDLINTPANDMGPAELEAAARALAERHGAKVHTIVGDDLLEQNFPLIHAVGRAAARPPRLIDVSWGDPGHPKVTLVGKGVCFDTGGLDIKPETGMLNMKKDMGGAATMLALAHMLMGRGAKLRLRVLIPAVENSISGSAFRPRDVYRSRKGLTVEIGNTDAEGRLILADALALADEEEPELIADMATLTGAARVALGTEMPPFYTDDDELAAELARFAASENDPLWRMPLWRPYDQLLDSKVADINNVSSGNFGGSITAALFLRRFVSAAKTWLHFDIFAWNQTSKPGRPEGGECQVARALYALLTARYG